jgi:hypothetical protein
MKIIWCAAVIILRASMARAADPVYARIQAASAQATLGNGKQFTTVQGDCYPFLGYDRQQPMMHLQFGPQSFWVQTEDAGLVPATNASNAAAQYNNEVAKLQSIASAPVAAPAPDPQTIQAIVNALEWPLRQMIRQEMAMHSEANSGTKGVNYADAFPVDSDSSAWQNSGVWVKAGQHVEVEADPRDRWSIGSGWDPVDANGYGESHDPLSESPVYHTGSPSDDWHWGALVGAVGSTQNELNDQSREVEIGLKNGFMAATNGYVFFICNDQRDFHGINGFDDNSGIIHVKVTVTDPQATPPPKIIADPAGLPTPPENPGIPRLNPNGYRSPADAVP